MPQIYWETPVVLADTAEDFPATGDSEKFYVDKSTASSEDFHDATLYYWTGTTYNQFTVGPRPKPHH